MAGPKKHPPVVLPLDRGELPLVPLEDRLRRQNTHLLPPKPETSYGTLPNGDLNLSWRHYAAFWIMVDAMLTVIVLAKEILILAKGSLSR